MLAPLLVVSGASGADAASKTKHHEFTPPWATAKVDVVRDGWTVRFTGTLKDARADGDCVYLKLKVVVDQGLDIQKRLPNNCNGKAGAAKKFDRSFTPGKGRALDEYVITVCADDAFADSCTVEYRFGVPGDRAAKPGKRPLVNKYMNKSMQEFQKARNKARSQGGDKQGLVWSSDGCTDVNNKPGGFNFLKACQRHDFGYRNYGKKPAKTGPWAGRKDFADSRFLQDMRAVCARQDTSAERTECNRYATAYYVAVRNLGGRAFWHQG